MGKAIVLMAGRPFGRLCRPDMTLVGTYNTKLVMGPEMKRFRTTSITTPRPPYPARLCCVIFLASLLLLLASLGLNTLEHVLFFRYFPMLKAMRP